MKKLLLSLLLLMVFIMTACSSGEESSSPSEGEASNDITIGLSNSTQDIDFFVALKQGVEQGAEQQGFNLISVNANNDSAKQIADIEDLVQQGVSAILVNPQDAEAIVPGIEVANAANIPVIAIDRGATAGELLAFLETDNVEMGQKAADYIAEKLKERHGDYVGKVVELQGLQGSTAARDRGEGFNKQMEEKYPNIEIVARQPADFNQEKALNVMTNILQANSEIDAVFGHNDDNAVGAANAIEQAGRFKPAGDDEHIYVIGIDGNRQAIQGIENGSIDATISQVPIKMGEMAVEYAKAYLEGNDVEAHTYTRNFLVTKENVETEDLWAKELK
ncbi:substrate-binding domain-containing protein [Halalkalibacter krulwichiae]|uniref:D-ribose-binding periplasmic protein n=1 Tax=Halalkalibacter krulwichiae TaxID=199441 RepID=A0A1X9M9Q2_9BACI|nr:substrate-binding domain-containing protein [Halalkalibacter krulwichiae]ARK30127.1 D-ribose-binding periplasmic protein precursor [Halalkalibacter krulwichiae]